MEGREEKKIEKNERKCYIVVGRRGVKEVADKGKKENMEEKGERSKKDEKLIKEMINSFGLMNDVN